MIRVYVAGPYTAPPGIDRVRSVLAVGANVRAALDAGERIRAAGLLPFVPHLYHYWGAPLDYEAVMRLCFAEVERCDVLVFLAHSPGVDREIAHALHHCIPVVDGVDRLLAAVEAGEWVGR